MNTANEVVDHSTIKERFIETDYIYYLKSQGQNFCLQSQGLIKMEMLLTNRMYREDKNILWPLC